MWLSCMQLGIIKAREARYCFPILRLRWLYLKKCQSFSVLSTEPKENTHLHTRAKDHVERLSKRHMYFFFSCYLPRKETKLYRGAEAKFLEYFALNFLDAVGELCLWGFTNLKFVWRMLLRCYGGSLSLCTWQNLEASGEWTCGHARGGSSGLQ